MTPADDVEAEAAAEAAAGAVRAVIAERLLAGGDALQPFVLLGGFAGAVQAFVCSCPTAGQAAITEALQIAVTDYVEQALHKLQGGSLQ